MKYILLSFAFLAGCSCSFHMDSKPSVSVQEIPQEVCAFSEHTIPCVHYKGAYDGDTFSVEIDDVPEIFRKWQVRVRGIDTPEIKGKSPCEQELADVARQTAAEVLSKAKTITLKNVGKDKYFRLLADVDVDGQDFATLLLSDQVAVKYDGGKKARFACPATLPEGSWSKLQNNWKTRIRPAR